MVLGIRKHDVVGRCVGEERGHPGLGPEVPRLCPQVELRALGVVLSAR